MWRQKHFTDTPILWEPQEDEGKSLKQFQKIVEEKTGLLFGNYQDFHEWSVENFADFWSYLYDFIGIVHSQKYDRALDRNVPISERPKWFEGARLNYAENMLRFRDDYVALILTGEDRGTEKVTYAEMFKEAELYAAAFRKLGLKKNDTVACYMSNRKEAVYAMQAVTSIGAIWTGALPLMGVQSVLSRFGQVRPKFLITVDRFMIEGEEIDLLPNVETIAKGLVDLYKVIIVPSKENSLDKDISRIQNSCFLGEFLQVGLLADGSVPPMEFEQVPFDHPVFISYTSGTTGLPTPLVHGMGVILGVYHFQSFYRNVGRDDIFLSVSPVGWASWILFTSFHFSGVTVMLYEGSPFYLSPTYFWDLVDEFQLKLVYVPTWCLEELQKRGYVPLRNLSTLKYIYTGGSAVKLQTIDFVKDLFKGRVGLYTAYGNTEIIGGGLHCEPTHPVRRGEISLPSLGVDMHVVNESGEPVVGEIGELVITNPFPSFTLGIWGDSDGSIFREKYLSQHPGMFSMGDYAIVNPITKGFIICGRCDDTMKNIGMRFGSSEIYNVVEQFPEIRDSLCVSQCKGDLDERSVLFVKLRDGHAFDAQLVSRIREAIASELTICHVPDVILETKDIPYNMNGKKMEIIVKKIINKMPHTTESVINQECLEYYYNVPELQLPFQS